MKQVHTKGVKIPGTVRASPCPGGEGRGEGERLSNPIFGLGGPNSLQWGWKHAPTTVSWRDEIIQRIP